MVLNYRMIGRLSGLILLILSAAMVPAVLISLAFNEAKAAVPFIACIVVMGLSGMAAQRIKFTSGKLTIRDGYAIVALCWLLGSLLGAVPFVLYGMTPNYIDAFFEAVSALTSTGISVLADVESLPKGMLFWRAFMQWLGGMGILLVAIAILPALGIGGQNLMKAETPGPVLDKMTPKIADTAKILYLIYLTMTALDFALLLIGGMSPFDALLHTFGTVATGGLSNYNAGISHFNSAYIEMVTAVFMMAAGVNYHIYYGIIKGRRIDLLKDEELRLYFFIIGLVTLVISIELYFSHQYSAISDILRQSFFQTTSFISTTAYATADLTTWSTFTKTILFFLLFVGGCSASTAGAIKIIRLLVIGKMIKRGFSIRLHQHAVLPIKVNGKILPADTVNSISSFVILYVVLFFSGTLLISLEDLGIASSALASASALTNGGCGFDLVDKAMHFGMFSAPSKLFLSFLMIAGRLELFTVILLLTPGFWNPNH